MTHKISPLERTASLLAQVSLFKDLEREHIQEIAHRTTELQVQRGDVILQRGDDCTGFHSVVHGRVKLSFTSVQGGEKVLELVGPGQAFGEAMIFVDKPHIITAQALEDSMLLHVSRDVVLEATEAHPRFARGMLEGLSLRLHELLRDVEAYSLNTGTQRVIDYLIKEVGEENSKIVLATSKTVVASRLNLTPEHFSRILHHLVGKHLISMQGRAISIPSMAKLRACLH